MEEQSDERKCLKCRQLTADSFARTPLSQSFVALNDRSLRDVDWDGMLILLSRLMRGLSLER